MKIPEKINLICILGPTASGKTAFAANLAHALGGEIISADSRQVYRGMDIGTGKDYGDYKLGDVRIPFHLIDIVDAGVEYNVFQYQKDFFRVFEGILNRGKIPVLCGGSGLYIEAVLKNYQLLQVPVNDDLRRELENETIEKLTARLKSYKNPHNTTDLIIRKRIIRAIEIEEFLQANPSSHEIIPEIKPLVLGINIDREPRREKITLRLNDRLANGMIEEVKNLMNGGITPEKLEYYGLEYKFISWYLEEKISYDEMFNSLNTAIHQYAKRQMTWFRKMEKEGTRIHWIDSNLSLMEKLSLVNRIFQMYY